MPICAQPTPLDKEGWSRDQTFCDHDRAVRCTKLFPHHDSLRPLPSSQQKLQHQWCTNRILTHAPKHKPSDDHKVTMSWLAVELTSWGTELHTLVFFACACCSRAFGGRCAQRCSGMGTQQAIPLQCRSPCKRELKQACTSHACTKKTILGKFHMQLCGRCERVFHSWITKFKGDRNSGCKLSNGWSRSYTEKKLPLSAGKWEVAKLQRDRSASQSSMELYDPWISAPFLISWFSCDCCTSSVDPNTLSSTSWWWHGAPNTCQPHCTKLRTQLRRPGLATRARTRSTPESATSEQSSPLTCCGNGCVQLVGEAPPHSHNFFFHMYDVWAGLVLLWENSRGLWLSQTPFGRGFLDN